MKKDYFNNSEMKELVSIKAAAYIMKNYLDCEEFNTKEKGDFKRARTYILKTLKSVYERFGEKEEKRFNRTFEGSNVVVLTQSELDILAKRKKAELKAAFEENKEYFELVEITMDLNCKNCKKHWLGCELCKHFDDMEMIPFGDAKSYNCKYAYTLETHGKGEK